jgi:hypothetical protein
MKPAPSASERSKHAAQIRKPGHVRRLTREEIAALEHQRNLGKWLRLYATQVGIFKP